MVTIAPSAQHVLDYLMGLGVVDPATVVASVQRDDGGFRTIRVEDLVDLTRRAVLLDSMSAEIDRQGAELARLRSRLPDEPGIVGYP